MCFTFRVWLAIATLAAVFPLHAGPYWPMTGGNARHTACSPTTGPSTPTLCWSYGKLQSNLDLQSGIAVGANGEVYIGTSMENDPLKDGLSALTAAGALKWWFPYDISDYPYRSSTPAVATDGTVYVTYDKLYALRPDGTCKWRFAKPGNLSSPVLGADGTVFLVAGSALYALNAAGQTRWMRLLDGTLSSPVLGLNGMLFVGTASSIYALSTINGATRGRIATGAVTALAVGSDGTLYAGAGEKLLAVSATGRISWTQNITVATGIAIGPAGTLYFGSGTQRLQAYSSSGSPLWSFADAATSDPLVGSDGVVYIVGGQYLRALNPDGTELWSYTYTFPDVAEFTTPAIGKDGMLHVGWNFYNDGYFGSGVYAFQTTGNASMQPDLKVLADSPEYLGNNIYNTDGAGQTVELTTVNAATMRFAVTIENDGAASTNFRLSAPAGSNGYSVTYTCYYQEMSNDITARITGPTGWVTGPLAPGKTVTLEVVVSADNAPAGSTWHGLITASSMGRTVNRDAVGITGHKSASDVNPQPDMLGRNRADASFIGDGIYNIEGIGQTLVQSVGGGQKALYYVRVQNDSTIDASFKVEYAAWYPGFTVRFYRTDTGAEITTALRAPGGWSTPMLAPGGLLEIRVESTPDATLNNGYAETIVVQAHSQVVNAHYDRLVLTTVKTGASTGIQPDLMGLAEIDQPDFTGNDIVDPTGNASISSRVSFYVNRPVGYTVRIQNDSTVKASFRITGTGNTSGWTVCYYRMDNDAEITAAVTGAGIVTPVLAPNGGYVDMRVEMIPDSAAMPLGTHTVYVTGTAIVAPYLADRISLLTCLDTTSN